MASTPKGNPPDLLHARLGGLPFYLQHPGHHGRRKFVIDLNVESPETFNDDNNVVLLFNVLKTLTFKGQKIDILLFNVVTPLTLIDDINVFLLFNVLKPDLFNDDNNVVLLFNVVDTQAGCLPLLSCQ